MQNNEFYSEIKTLLFPYLGTYTSSRSQIPAFTFHEQPRNNTSVTGLEVVIYPVYRELIRVERYSVYTDVHAVVLLQNLGAEAEHIYTAVDKIVAYGDKVGAFRSRTVWRDADGSQQYLKSAQVVLNLSNCDRAYDECDDEQGV